MKRHTLLASAIAVALLAGLSAGSPARAAEDEAATPPYDRGRIYWNTTTILTMGGVAAPSGSGDTRMRARLYEFLTIATKDAGVEGLSASVSGWIVGDLLETYSAIDDDRFRGDLLYGNVSWQGLDDNFRIKLGRQYVWAGAVGGLILDGLSVAGDLPWDIELSAYGGISAPPRFRYAADEYEWDYAVGARAAWAPWDIGHVAVSYAREGHGADLAREQVGVDLSFTYFDAVQAWGSVLVDLVNKDFDEGRLHVDAEPIDGLHVELDYEGVDTTSRIRKTSIFHVFSDDVYHSVGGSVDWQSEGWLGLSAGYRHYVYADHGDGGDQGYKVSAGARLLLDRKTRDVVGVEYGRLDADTNAYHQARVYARLTVAEHVFVGADLNNYFYDHELRGYDRTHFANVLAGWEILPGMKLEGDFGVMVDPRFDYELHGMLRFVYEGTAPVGG